MIVIRGNINGPSGNMLEIYTVPNTVGFFLFEESVNSDKALTVGESKR